jgi:cytochrome bd-type quinol oxidase subunit 2
VFPCLRGVLVLSVLCAATSCARPAPHFSEANARAHINHLAGTIGSRPAGTEPNARARAYVIDQLRLFGFEVRVQEVDAARPEFGLTARVRNVIAIKRGRIADAIAIVSHYDSHPDTHGAGDAALGSAVALEAARLLAAHPLRHTLSILLTDGEELGLMGAAGLVDDREAIDPIRAYLNLEAIGAGGAAVLFESGPDNGWIVGPWARAAPHPRGSSYMLEVYRRLPNDTDFTILKRTGRPGLNFAAVDDSYAYHTTRDTPDRVTSKAVVQTGQNVIAIVQALDQEDLNRRTATHSIYFDVGRTIAVAYPPRVGTALTVFGCLLALIAWARLLRLVIAMTGVGRVAIAFVVGLIGMVIAGAAMVGATWLLRAARSELHPWYAHPERLIALLVTVAAAVVWATARLGAVVTTRLHPARHPALLWMIALPLWGALAAFMEWQAPAASYLWTLPLLTAGLLLSVGPVALAPYVRAASVVILAAAGTLWIRDTIDLTHFAVAALGRMSIVTPTATYGVLVAIAGIMMTPPVVAVVMTDRPLRRPAAVTGVLLLAIVTAFGAAYAADAYTSHRPLRRYAHFVQDVGAQTAHWELGSHEPGLDVDAVVPRLLNWTRASGAPPYPFLPGFRAPFVFRAPAAADQIPPASLSARVTTASPGETVLEIDALPQLGGLSVEVSLPAGVAPLRSNLPGAVRRGVWGATYAALPPAGVSFRLAMGEADTARRAIVIVRTPGLPGGQGWQRLPGWLPQERVVWEAASSFIIPVATLLKEGER